MAPPAPTEKWYIPRMDKTPGGEASIKGAYPVPVSSPLLIEIKTALQAS
jgi:hypothetical protein